MINASFGSVFPDGQIDAAWEIPSDAFPTSASADRRRLVDIGYARLVPAPVAVDPPQISGFANGAWAGTIKLTGTADIYLAATDLAGRTGVSPAANTAYSASLCIHQPDASGGWNPLGNHDSTGLECKGRGE